jgi:hypothetical protein
VPNPEGAGKHYRAWFFEPELAPMVRSPRIAGRTEHRRVRSLEEALAELVELANSLSCQLVAFTEHELKIVAAHLPETSSVRRNFEALYLNIHPPARSLANRRGLAFEKASLEGLMGALSPGFKFPEKPLGDVAETCRRLRRAGEKSQRWRSWTPRHQQLAIDLIAYNQGDCKAVWKLVNRVVGSYRINELE